MPVKLSIRPRLARLRRASSAAQIIRPGVGQISSERARAWGPFAEKRQEDRRQGPLGPKARGPRCAAVRMPARLNPVNGGGPAPLARPRGGPLRVGAFRFGRGLVRDLRRDRRRRSGAQARHQRQELGSQLVAAQLLLEPSGLLWRGTAAQPFETVAVTFADFVRRQIRGFQSRGRRSRTHAVSGRFGVPRRAIRAFRDARGNAVLAVCGGRNHAVWAVRSGRLGALRGEQFLDLRSRRLGVGAVPMSGEERAPSVERSNSLSNPIVELLVDKRRPCRVDAGVSRFRPHRRNGLLDDGR